jgi:predicted transcriptional regulator
MYPNTLEKIMLEISGKKEMQLFFLILDRPSKSNPDFTLDQKRIAKKLGTTQPYVSKLINKFIRLGMLTKTQQKPMAKYRINPYLYIPAYADGVKLQDEWDILNHVVPNKKVRDVQDYLDYLLSDEWKDKANKVKERDGNQCVQCGSDKQLEVHHLTYDNIYEEPLEDLVTLCHTCHEKEHHA